MSIYHPSDIPSLEEAKKNPKIKLIIDELNDEIASFKRFVHRMNESGYLSRGEFCRLVTALAQAAAHDLINMQHEIELGSSSDEYNYRKASSIVNTFVKYPEALAELAIKTSLENALDELQQK